MFCGEQQKPKPNVESTKVASWLEATNKETSRTLFRINCVYTFNCYWHIKLTSHFLMLMKKDITNRQRLSINCVKATSTTTTTMMKKWSGKEQQTTWKIQIENACGNGKTTWALKWIYILHINTESIKSMQMQTQTRGQCGRRARARKSRRGRRRTENNFQIDFWFLFCVHPFHIDLIGQIMHSNARSERNANERKSKTEVNQRFLLLLLFSCFSYDNIRSCGVFFFLSSVDSLLVHLIWNDSPNRMSAIKA